MKLAVKAAMLAALAFLAAPVAAQEGDRIPYISPRDAEMAINRALELLPKAKCGDGPCQAATTEEFVSPPVDLEDARLAMLTGAKSARLKWCGLEWEKRAIVLMMQRFQQKGINSIRNLTILQIIHNDQFGRDYASLQALKTCDGTLKTALDRENPVIELPPWQRTINNALLDTSVADMLRRVLDDIQNARCGDDPCSPATAEEKANPPVNIEDARQAMKVGLLSGVADFCGLDWKNRIFLPYIAHKRASQNMSVRQLAILATLYSTMQGFMSGSYKKRGQPCTDDMRQALEKHLSAG
jgi:hypothetical protein